MSVHNQVGNQPEADELFGLLEQLFPITRSITGQGVRTSLAILQEHAPLNIVEYSSGTKVYDWTIPKEWNIQDAYIADENGNRIVDYQENGLHVVGYSIPINSKMSFTELLPYLHTLPNLPNAIPYRTSYYKESWGFCLTQNQLDTMDHSADYEVVIRSELTEGSLVLGEALLKGESEKELLISTYCCHPWMANDNQSGMVVATFLHRYLAQKKKLRYSYRFVWLPETIGAITYLAHNEEVMKAIEGGFVISCCGGQGKISYKETYLGNHLMDRAVMLAFRDQGIEPWMRPFAPDGSDERQYSMPAFRIPMCTISKDKYYDYRYYHTSLDDLEFVSGDNLLATYRLYIDAIEILEKNVTYKTLMPYCEPQLGRRGLYPLTGGGVNQSVNDEESVNSVSAQLDAITWMMFLADGGADLVTIAERSGQPIDSLFEAAEKLKEKGLLEITCE